MADSTEKTVRQRWEALVGHEKFQSKVGAVLGVDRATIGRYAQTGKWPPYAITILEVCETVPLRRLPEGLRERLSVTDGICDGRCRS